MEPRTRLILNEFAFTIVGWTFLTYLYYFFAFWGHIDLVQDPLIKAYIDGPAAHLELISQGFFFGMFLALINHVTETTALRRRSFGQIILIKTVLYVIAMAVVSGIVYLLFVTLAILPEDSLRRLWLELPTRLYVSFFLFIAFAILVLNFVLEIRRKVGPGNLLSLLVGRYHRPRIEERIFLFLDLKGSTGIAEELGHIHYSRFIRSCFHDLTELVIRYGAEIYQYVGDEVVLSWPARTIHNRVDCLRIFFAFEEKLQRRGEEYRTQFGTVPIFRGGIDMGSVTVAEVGDIKREIAYHGDVLNTAARLQELCKTYRQELLVSERVQAVLQPDPHFVSTREGTVALRGKTRPVGIYSISLNRELAA